MTLFDEPFNIIDNGRRDISYMNIEKTRSVIDTTKTYKFGKNTEKASLLKLYALGLSNESNKYTRQRVMYIDVLSNLGGLAKVVFFSLSMCYVFFGQTANMLHLAIMY